MKQLGFLDVEEQLEAFSLTVNFEIFRPDPEKALAYSGGSKGGASAGYLPMSDQILDATLVTAPRQCNTNVEKADLRVGLIPEGWQNKPSKLSHKDRHARWRLKFMKAKQSSG